MRLPANQIKALQILLKKHCGLELTDEQAQNAGAAILKFYVAKQTRTRGLKDKCNGNGDKNYGSRPL